MWRRCWAIRVRGGWGADGAVVSDHAWGHRVRGGDGRSRGCGDAELADTAAAFESFVTPGRYSLLQSRVRVGTTGGAIHLAHPELEDQWVHAQADVCARLDRAV